MSTLRTTNIIHGSSSVSNIVLDNQGRAIFGPDGPNGRASLYVNAQNNRVGVNTETPSVALDVDGAINATGNVAFGGTLDVTGTVSLSGNLGVGTSTPRNLAGFSSIGINGTSGALLDLFRNGTREGTVALDSGGFKLEAVGATTDIIAITNGSERVRILENGNVGIGTTSPTSLLSCHQGILGSTSGDTLSLLDLYGVSTNADYLKFELERTSGGSNWTTAAHKIYRQIDTTEKNFIQFGFDTLSFGIGSNQHLLINGAGQVIVGAGTPGDKLNIGDTSDAFTAIRIQSTNTGIGELRFADSDSTNPAYVKYEHNTNDMVFATNGAERVHIDSNGHLGLGDSNPYCRFKAMHYELNTTNIRPDESIATFGAVGSNGIYLGFINSQPIGYPSYLQSGFLDAGGTVQYPLLLNPRGGNVGINNTNPNRQLHVVDNRTNPASVAIEHNSGGTAGGGAVIFANYYESNNTSLGFVQFNADQGGTPEAVLTVNGVGDVKNKNNSYGPISSDERLKQDISDANSQWDDIKNIRITTFHYKNEPTGPLHLGPIAQELEQVSPGLITRRPASKEEVADPTNDLVDGDEVLSFKGSILYMKAVKALQEAMERIETLEANNLSLETRIATLENS